MTKTAHIASQWFPTASAERLKPVCRFMLWTLYNDDRCEECNLQELYRIRDRVLTTSSHIKPMINYRQNSFIEAVS